MVVVSGRKLVEDLRKRPDEELSFMEAVDEVSVTCNFTAP